MSSDDFGSVDPPASESRAAHKAAKTGNAVKTGKAVTASKAVKRRSRDSDPGPVAVGPFDARSLRSHADPIGIDRVWDRLEPKLNLSRRRTPTRIGRLPLAVAAIAAGFAGGIASSDFMSTPHKDVNAVVVSPTGAESTRDIFAAGTTPRSYPLPGGGTITLEPGSIVDTVRRKGSELTLRLVRGNATFTTGSNAFALQVGGAQVTASGGARLAVRRDGDHALLEVFEGAAEVTAPNQDNDMVASRLGPNDVRRVRVRRTTAALPHATQRNPMETHRDGSDDESSDTELPTDGPPDTPAGAWDTLVASAKVACQAEQDDMKTVKLLESSPGAASQITDPVLLACVARGHQMLGHSEAAEASYEKLMRQPNKFRAHRAASKLMDMYKKRTASATTDAERKTYAAKTKAVELQLRKLQLASVAEGKNLEVFERAEALCNRIQAEAGTSNHSTVIKLSAKYKGAYPNGPCTATINAILAKLPATSPGTSGSDDDGKESKSSSNDAEAGKTTGEDGPYEEAP